MNCPILVQLFEAAVRQGQGVKKNFSSQREKSFLRAVAAPDCVAAVL